MGYVKRNMQEAAKDLAFAAGGMHYRLTNGRENWSGEDVHTEGERLAIGRALNRLNQAQEALSEAQKLLDGVDLQFD